MALVDVSSVPQVALQFQNDDHAQEARLLNDVAEALDRYRGGAEGQETVLAPLDALLEHTRDHFERENRVMIESGFPAFPMHGGEHGRVLAEMEREVFAFREHGDVARLSSYLRDGVLSWFVHHIQTMDAVTGQFVAHHSA